jgi:hypothetical protein
MAVVYNPTIKNSTDPERRFKELPIRADATSAQAYIEEKALGTYTSFTSNNDNRFANDGGHLYNYYISGETYTDYWLNTGVTYSWRTEFGYYATISGITYS